MLDVAWSELLVIAIILIVVVGPKDLPPMLRAFGRFSASLRKMAGEFRSQFDEAMREAELDEVRKTLNEAQKLNPSKALGEAFDPLRQAGRELRADIERATSAAATTASASAHEAPETVPGGVVADLDAADALPEAAPADAETAGKTAAASAAETAALADGLPPAEAGRDEAVEASATAATPEKNA